MPASNFPDFLCIGAQKAGTTWLYENLRANPQIYFPPMKEVHFWDLFEERGLDWYRSLFDNAASGQIRGEITPAYAILPKEKIAEIYALNPKLRVIYIVRNPIDRAWSAAKMELARAELDFNATPDEWFIDEFNSDASCLRGGYKACLANWLSIFPKAQILLLDYKEIAKNPRDFYFQCLDHIGCDKNVVSDEMLANLSAKIFAGEEQKIRPSLYKILQKLYPDADRYYADLLEIPPR